MLAGNIPGKTGTISQKIAMVIQDGDYLTAGIWVAVVMLIAFAVIFTAFICSGRVFPSAFPPRAMTMRFFFLFSIVKIPLVLPKISIFADQKTKYGLKRAAGPGVRLKLRLTQAM